MMFRLATSVRLVNRVAMKTASPVVNNRNCIRPLPIQRFNSTLEIGKYNQLADHALEHILDEYEMLAESVPEIDVELAQGVLTLILPPIGTYVINKQPPNKQIWLSSPKSGPKRYDWSDGKWVYLRDNSTLGDLLRDETKLVTDEKGCDAIELGDLD